MSESVKLRDSVMQVKYRVTEIITGKILFSSEIYARADEFCWLYEGNGELQITKVWVRK